MTPSRLSSWFLLYFLVLLLSCIWGEVIIDLRQEDGEVGCLEGTTITSYVVERFYPQNNLILVNKYYHIVLWPKDEEGKNTTIHQASLTIAAKPQECMDFKRIETQNTSAMTLQFKVTKPANPFLFYILDQNKPISPAIKLAAIEEGSNVDLLTSSVELSSQSAQMGSNLLLKLNILDIFGKPSSQGAREIVFGSSVEMSTFHFHQVDNSDEFSSYIFFSINATQLGEYPLNITYKGNHLCGSPLSFRILPGNKSDTKSQIIGYGTWIAKAQQPNTLYVRMLDDFSNEIVTTPHFEGTDTSTRQEEQEIKEKSSKKSKEMSTLANRVTAKAWNVKKEELESFSYAVEYIGKSRWAIRYSLNQTHSSVMLLALYFDNDPTPIGGEILSIKIQTGEFPFPPSKYQQIGPFPARQELLEPAPHTISTSPLHSFTLDKNGWLIANEFVGVPLADTDYRAEMVGTFSVETAGLFLFLCTGVEYYHIDYPILYSGNVWNVHALAEGEHSLQVALTSKRDWHFKFQCRFQHYVPLKAYLSENMISDVIHGEFMGDVFVTLQNLHNTPILDLQVTVLALNDTSVLPMVELPSGLVLGAQEINRFPLSFSFLQEPSSSYFLPSNSFLMVLEFYSPSLQSTTRVAIPVRVRSEEQSFRFVFTDSDGSGQLAVVRKPIEICTVACPVIVVPHGGGVEVSSLSEHFPSLPAAWWIFPNGRTEIPYELGPLFESNIMAAVQGLTQLTNKFSFLSSFPADPSIILSIGSHFYGGRGALELAIHDPDRIIGISANSGWIKHNKPNLASHFLHPMIMGLLEWNNVHSDISFHSSNLKDVPLLAGSGFGDLNDFPWLLLYQRSLFDFYDVKIFSDPIVSLSYKKHATTAIPPTANVLAFVNHILASPQPKKAPESFTVTSSHPDIFQGKGGVHITAFQSPLQIASINVETNGNLWILNTKNTRAFELIDRHIWGRASQILIDGVDSFMIDTSGPVRFLLNNVDGRWKEQGPEDMVRRGNQYGPVNRIYRNRLTVVCGTQASADVNQMYQLFSIYIANELFKQHQLDARILSDVQYNRLEPSEQTNIILIGGPHTNSATKILMESTIVPVRYENGEIEMAGCHLSAGKDVAALFLVPHGNHTAFIISASSLSMMQSAMHILPLHSPYDHFPDFLLLHPEHSIHGGNSIHTMGYWDSEWKSQNSATFSACPKYQKSNQPKSFLW